MKRIIRRNTFETNSSSTHSLTINTAKQWEEFKTTDKYLANWDGELFLVDDLIKNELADQSETIDLSDREACIKALTKRDRWDDAEYFTYEDWGTYEWSDWAEVDVQKFKTPSGDEMVAVACYGYNG